ncbi:hypothetical protein HDK90DRAFT_499647 [Phyllosticta capitalensis]|uniref:Uncharacterized protein n=1 Tax=Phyllosticta capitalensis TaxID=121624 RepID=A0ABR1YB55_9PEZI
MSFFLIPEFRHHVSRLGNIIEKLSVLRLSISCWDIRQGEHWGALLQLISKAKKLKVLHLKLEDLAEYYMPELFDAINSLPLEELHLDGVVFSKRAFLLFLYKQRSTLKKLAMDGCFYGGSSWQRLLEEARTTRGVLQVEELYINTGYIKDPHSLGYLIDEFLVLPSVPRHLIMSNGRALWRRWMAEPTPENFPLALE